VRYFIQLSFDGTAYHGWQIQDNAHSVQAELNKALSILFQEEMQTLGCGRTDTGVHAKKFYAHFDSAELPKQVPEIVHQLNCLLPHDIAIQNIISVDESAHARFDAVSRTYEYRIYKKKDPFLRNTAWYFPHELDLDLMNELSKEIQKYTDFSCFSKSRTQTKTNNCTITEVIWKQNADITVFRISANRFLRNMVRAIVGTLTEGGRGELTLQQLQDILASGNRSEAGPSVPAQGLSLIDIRYPFIND
jgi:tRNA pseudouridine38-40 synthase